VRTCALAAHALNDAVSTTTAERRIVVIVSAHARRKVTRATARPRRSCPWLRRRAATPVTRR
jgi:hypothetical protein